MSKATAGSWRTEAVSDAVRVVVGEGRKKIILARLAPKQLPEAETHANARLMAAAPDLLAALKEMYDYHGGTHEEDCEESDTCDCKHKEFNDRVNAAISNADGLGWKPSPRSVSSFDQLEAEAKDRDRGANTVRWDLHGEDL